MESNYCRLSVPQQLSVILRRETSGPQLAEEPVKPADLSDAVAEAWRDQCLRGGCPELALADLSVTLVPLFPEGPAGSLIEGFSVEIALPDGQSRKQSFSLECLRPVAKRAVDGLVEKGLIGEDGPTLFELSVKPASALASADALHASSYAFNLKSSPPTCLRVPLRPLLKRATVVNELAEEVFPVFFTSDAFSKAEACSRRGADCIPPVESGGVLVGSLAFCQDTKEFFVVVVDTLEVNDAQETTFSLGYSGQSWNRIQAIMKARQSAHPQRAERMVGQCHGHNFLPNNGKRCSECDKLPVCSLSSVFVSQDDQTWMQAVFTRQPWALCQIFGLNARKEQVQKLYSLKDGTWQARGYFLLPDSADDFVAQTSPQPC